MSILDPSFRYTSSQSTDVLSTWKRFGFMPTTEAERIARQRKAYAGYTTTQPPHVRDTQRPDFSLRLRARRSDAR
jgi:hypothetical protein